ncbi:hypothetical protein ATJ88_2132 [Isoptericola jiangsuensis]|uniref:Uncharacterized protein n=1 Tax=Isoptericola jiangsuensis TaxID=548579 RepID=A0A2A9EYY7_9MICO|nr:hypothetical protein [Isoptericola jiangsuensis]PFG43435.1 hypothetical protein ATJ88_2132 [Isoptericola jiangsuensis]
MRRRFWRTTATASALGLAALGVGSAASAEDLATTTDETVRTTVVVGAPTLARTGTGSGTATDTAAARWAAALQELVDDGTITAEQRDAAVAGVTGRRTATRTTTVTSPGSRTGTPSGGSSRAVPGAVAGTASVPASGTSTDEDVPVVDHACAAVTLGLTVEELRTALAEHGATLASVADARGVGAGSLVRALTTDAGRRIDAAVAAGSLSVDDAAERTAVLAAVVRDAVQAEYPDPLVARRGLRTV